MPDDWRIRTGTGSSSSWYSQGRGLSPSSLPAATGAAGRSWHLPRADPADAVPPLRAAGAGMSPWWLPGLHRAVPSTPLDELYEVVFSTLTDPAGHSPGQTGLASRAWTRKRGAGYSSPPTGGRS